MKKAILPWIAVVMVVLSMPYCKKKKTDSCSTESTLAVSTTPANGSTELPAPGPNFNLTVSVTSTMPPSGVTIEVKARPESSATPFYTESKSTSTKDNAFTITSTPATVTCIVEITVTSKTCNTNKWTGSYRYSKK